MEMSQTKQRIIGIIVLLGLLAIIIPLMMNTSPNDGNSRAELEVSMPIAPEAPIMELVEAPEPPAKITVEEDEVQEVVVIEKVAPQASFKKEAVKPVVAIKKPSTTAPVKSAAQPTATAAKKPVEPVVTLTKKEPIRITSPKKAPALTSGSAWNIQVGSFGNKNNVVKLVESLKSQGFKVFTKDVTTVNGMLTRVYVGPEIEQSVAQQKLTQIERQFNLKGRVVKQKI